MNALFRGRARQAARLSAYLDGELDQRQAASIAEDLIFDPEASRLLRTYRKLDELTKMVLEPARYPNPDVVCERLLQAGATQMSPDVEDRPLRDKRRGLRSGALWAAVGLLVTGGVALAGLRRRGLV